MSLATGQQPATDLAVEVLALIEIYKKQFGADWKNVWNETVTIDLRRAS